MKRQLGAGILLAVLVAGICMCQKTGERSAPVSENIKQMDPILILDAGHGGEDGGAVSISGVSESRINLELVEKMDDLLGLYGTAPLLLRRTDVSLHGSEAHTLHEKKVSDLKNRAEIVRRTEGATLISIHQNTYPSGDAHGLQAFYAPTDGSKELAELIQRAVQETIQKENRRTAKQIPKSVYLMNHIPCRAVLVECGFLSNAGEERDLLDPIYQRRLAAVLACTWLTGGAL